MLVKDVQFPVAPFSAGDVTGMIDAHVHITGSDGMRAAREAGMRAVRNAGRTMSSFAGGDPACIHSGDFPVISCCWALYKKGGYGSLFGVPVETKAQIGAEILKLKNAGADIIKVMASGIVSLRNPGTLTAGGFTAKEIGYIVETAAALGLPVMAHANGEEAIMAAAEAGVRSVEHGFFVTLRALSMMARKQIYWVPTVGALVRAAESAGAGKAKNAIAGTVSGHLEMLRVAYETGVPLAVGTDCVLPDLGYRAAYAEELCFFRQAGISRSEVLRLATAGGAGLLGL